jgi:hypothetical protein
MPMAGILRDPTWYLILLPGTVLQYCYAQYVLVLLIRQDRLGHKLGCHFFAWYILPNIYPVLPVVILQYKSLGHILASRTNFQVEQGYFWCIPYKMAVTQQYYSRKNTRKNCWLVKQYVQSSNFVLLTTLLKISVYKIKGTHYVVKAPLDHNPSILPVFISLNHLYRGSSHF